jgi:3-phosphoglycerate kinase
VSANKFHWSVTISLRTLDPIEIGGKRVLVRADLNVPVRDGKTPGQYA